MKKLACAATTGQGELRRDGIEEVFLISQSTCITGASPSDCFASYPGHLLGEVLPSAEMQLVYSTSPAKWATRTLIGGGLTLCRDAVGVFYIPREVGKDDLQNVMKLKRIKITIIYDHPQLQKLNGYKTIKK